MLTATAEEPLSLTSITRSFVADSITPISAYLALAQPGRSCMLESVHGTERISRFSFIGLDYLETFAIDRDPRMLERIRAAVGRYALDRTDLPAASVFAGANAESAPPTNSFGDFLANYGRIEVIWFPFTNNPWVHLWKMAPNQGAGLGKRTQERNCRGTRVVGKRFLLSMLWCICCLMPRRRRRESEPPPRARWSPRPWWSCFWIIC